MIGLEGLTLSAKKSWLKKQKEELLKTAPMDGYKFVNKKDSDLWCSISKDEEEVEAEEKLVAKLKAAKNTQFQDIYDEAYAAGIVAGNNAIPTPMVVVGSATVTVLYASTVEYQTKRAIPSASTSKRSTWGMYSIWSTSKMLILRETLPELPMQADYLRSPSSTPVCLLSDSA
ncbi:hypothetical protein AXF24_12525 [Streptococcus pneumoniae]|nr:hypothetical protein AWW74_12540 [Streptococcus pneumoniae]KXB94836.1 hypothetical protein AXF24_12525 [Streptococcus pneumoniae]